MPVLSVPDAAAGPDDAVQAAMRLYRAGEPLDMSALAAELGIGRATLYRWVGNREALLARVLADSSAQTFRVAEADARDGGAEGAELVVDVIRRFMTAVAQARPLGALVRREPLVFIRLVAPAGVVEQRVAGLIARVLEREARSGRLALPLPPAALATAIVRLSDAHLYTYLLGRRAPDVDGALDIVRVLLGAAPRLAA